VSATTDWIGAIGGGVGALVGLVGGGMGIAAYVNQRNSTKANERSAKAAEDSAKSGERSAASAEKSEQHAKVSADAAIAAAETTARQATTDAEGLHDSRDPNPKVEFDRRESSGTASDNLFAKVTVAADCVANVYLVHNEAGGQSVLQQQLPLHAGLTADLYVDMAPTGESKTGRVLLFHFWPVTSSMHRAPRRAYWSFGPSDILPSGSGPR